jgi:branched-chain amino acid transport system substrate-binding protein
MRRLPLGRALALGVWVALAAALAGCATTASSSSIPGSRLTVYASRPPGPLTDQESDILAAERLAIDQAGRRVGKFTVGLVQAQGNELSANARAAISDATTIAYLGEIVPGTSAQTIGITNAEDVLQVSPTDTAVELTQATRAVSGSPDTYYESLSTYGRTFARTVPTDQLEARALVDEMRTLGVRSLYIATDGSAYGRALRLAVVSDASGITIAPGLSAADAVLYAGRSPSGATHTFDQAAAARPSVKLFAPSALADDQFAAGLSAAAQHAAYVSSPGFTSADLPPAGAQFAAAFKAAYGHAPASEAVFGYAAMQAVLAALHRAGAAANDRATVVRDFFALRDQNSAVGAFSIDKRGDIAFSGGAPFVISRIRAGRLVAVKAVHE